MLFRFLGWLRRKTVYLQSGMHEINLSPLFRSRLPYISSSSSANRLINEPEPFDRIQLPSGPSPFASFAELFFAHSTTLISPSSSSSLLSYSGFEHNPSAVIFTSHFIPIEFPIQLHSLIICKFVNPFSPSLISGCLLISHV